MAFPRPGSIPTVLAQPLRTVSGAGSAWLRRTSRAVVAGLADVARRIRRRPAEDRAATAPHPGTAVVGPRRLARRLSAGVAGLMAGASAVGLVRPGLYQDPAATTAMFRGYDLGSLAVATPVLVGALARSRHGSPRADLLWAGMLAYVVYTYAYYVFGAAFNALFLVHVVLFVLAAVALVLTLRALDVRLLADRVGQRTPVRAVSAVLGVLAASLGGMWTWFSLRFAATGAAPEEGLLLQPAPIGHLGYAMDLSTLVPGYATAAALLWRRRPWGYVLAGVLLTASAVVQVNYMLALAFQAADRIPGATAFDPQEPYIAVAIAGAAAVLLAGMRRPPAAVTGSAHTYRSASSAG